MAAALTLCQNDPQNGLALAAYNRGVLRVLRSPTGRDLSRLARVAVAVAGCLFALGLSANAAQAAEFTSTPGASVFSSGAGPFGWGFASSSSASGEMGWVGYKLSTETAWHRCLQYGSAMLANLPDGTYTIEIADDVNVNYLNSHGLLESGFNTCGDGNPPDSAASASTITIDSTPPTVGLPEVIVSNLTVQASVQASDAGTGVASYAWSFGDGAIDQTTTPYDRHTYLAYGTYSGSVVVTDGAGNRSQAATFTAVLAAPSTAQGSNPSSSRTTPTKLAVPRHATQPKTEQTKTGGVALDTGIVASCPATDSTCIVRAILTATLPSTAKSGTKRHVVIASLSLAISGGSSRAITIPLPRSFLVRLKRLRHVPASISVRLSVSGAAAVATIRKMTLNGGFNTGFSATGL